MTYLIVRTVSLQTVAASVHALGTGLYQVRSEIEQSKGAALSPDDHFVKVMEVGNVIPIVILC